jgi:hypothetical protein
VLWIRIRMFLSFSDPSSHKYGSGDPDPSIIKQIVRKTLISTVL